MERYEFELIPVLSEALKAVGIIPGVLAEAFVDGDRIIIQKAKDDRTVIVRREKICDNCCGNPKTPLKQETDGMTLLKFLDGLSSTEQRAALIHLSVKWAEQQGGKNDIGKEFE